MCESEKYSRVRLKGECIALVDIRRIATTKNFDEEKQNNSKIKSSMEHHCSHNGTVFGKYVS